MAPRTNLSGCGARVELLERRDLLSGSAHPASIVPDASPAALVVRPHGTVAGKTLGQWSAKWWQLMLSIPSSQNPLMDTTGANAGIGESGPVFFLGGTTPAINGPVVRNISIPTGKFLFFPLINVENNEIGDVPPETPAQLYADIAPIIAASGQLSATVDGVTIPDLATHLETSSSLKKPKVFSFTVPADNILGASAQSSTAVSEGYWLMVRPLKPGQHVIHFGGFLGAPFSLTQDVTYNITVTAKHAKG